MTEKPSVLVIGAGLAGLACAWNLRQNGVSCQILEASSSVGGRVKTDRVNGFLLDRGFQVLLTAYPEAKRILDYDKLSLKDFYPGALVRVGNGFHRVADPFRHPIDAFYSIHSPIGTLTDKFRIARLRRRVLAGGLEDLFNKPERKTIEALKKDGFSGDVIETFFRPFFGGVFLDPELQTTSRMFDFVFRMFSAGDTSVPADGMGAIPEQIHAKLPTGSVMFDTPVRAVTGTTVQLATGEPLSADRVVIATDAHAAARLMGTASPASHSVACLYFAADEPPIDEPILVLNGGGGGPVNNMCVPSLISNTYAPDGATLISTTILRPERYDPASLEAEVRRQLGNWFGPAVNKWQLLRSYWIKRALPVQSISYSNEQQQAVSQKPGVYTCGDHTDTASINGALRSGRLTAKAIVRDLAGPAHVVDKATM